MSVKSREGETHAAYYHEQHRFWCCCCIEYRRFTLHATYWKIASTLKCQQSFDLFDFSFFFFTLSNDKYDSWGMQMWCDDICFVNEGHTHRLIIYLFIKFVLSFRHLFYVKINRIKIYQTCSFSTNIKNKSKWVNWMYDLI